MVEREFGKLACGRPLSAAIATAWRRTVGGRVARRALPLRLRGETLHVRVATSAWLHELQMLGPSILERLQLEPGCDRIRRLRFEVGALPRSPLDRSPDEPEPAAAAPRAALPAEVVEALEGVSDPLLRARIEQTLDRALAGR